jgi:hypothetical protein
LASSVCPARSVETGLPMITRLSTRVNKATKPQDTHLSGLRRTPRRPDRRTDNASVIRTL